MTEAPLPDRLRPVRLWLYAVAGLVFAMVLLGGATRLTGSGLSITEWRPVTGTIPPLSAQDWAAEFAKYQRIPQYQIVNRGMSLEAFKTIYWWEWAHRFLGRLIGLAFVLPALWFAWTGRIGRALGGRLLALFALGGAQGFGGWFMVSSGLSGRVSVSQYRLAFHLTLATAILALLLWTARGLRASAPEAGGPTRLRWTAAALLGLVFLQIFLGALVAGLDAGLSYSTWPLMDGRLLPPASQLLAMQPAWANLFENVLTVQFSHRVTAYILLALATVHAVDAAQSGSREAARRAWGLAGLVWVQAGLGILTLLWAVPTGLALLHQAGAVVVLALATLHAHALACAGSAARLPAPRMREAVPA